MKVKCSEDDFRQTFRFMDEDGKGFLTMADLKRMNLEMESNISEEDLQDMMEDADIDGLGIVTEDNFVRFMMEAQEDEFECTCEDS